MKTAILLFLIFTCSDAPAQVILDTGFIKNSNKYKPKLSWSVTGGAVRKVSIGDYKILHIEKGKRRITDTRQEKFFQVYNDQTALMKTKITEREQPFLLTMGDSNNDSMFIHMTMREIDKNNKTLVRFSRSEPTEKSSSLLFCKEAIIQTIDSTEWKLYSDTINNIIAIGLKMQLFSSSGDTILIEECNGFRQVKSGSLSQGIVFIENGKQLAALQTWPLMAWVRNDLEKQKARILTAAMVTILAAVNSLPGMMETDD